MTAPAPRDPLNPQFEIWIAGSELPPEAKADLVSVEVEEAIDATGMFVFTIGCWDVARMQVKWIDDKLFDQGNPVEVRLGYRDELESVFAGEITALEPEFMSDEVPVLGVRGFDLRHRLMGKRRTRSFLQMKDSEIAAQIAQESNLRTEIADTQVALEYVLQHNQSDFEFLQTRASRLGFELFVIGKTLYFRPRPTEGAGSIQLKRETGLLDFRARLSALGQFDQVQVQGWDLRAKRSVRARIGAGSERVVGAASGSGGTRAFAGTEATGVRVPVASQDEADQLAAGWLNEMALQYMNVEGVCVGRADLRPGLVVEIEGLGRRFSGAYYLTQTRHTMRPSVGYRTAFTAKRNSAP